MNLIDAFLELLYPPRCIVCDDPILDDGYCEDCEGKVKPITAQMCFYCGAELEFCECNKYIYHFDGITAPFFNEGYAKQAVYDLKFNEKFNCVKTFSKLMAKYAKNTFGHENIDLICCVPSSKASMYNRGFNQSALFAKEISKLLKLEFKPKLLVRSSEVKTQHRIRSIDDRFANVRGGFRVTSKIIGKNVLLVDDIKTSGATIDECARQLKFAGANKVYCVVALMSSKNIKDKTDYL